jgi:hypothetical protein
VWLKFEIYYHASKSRSNAHHCRSLSCQCARGQHGRYPYGQRHHFNTNATINWNATALTTSRVSANQLTVTIPNADLATSGTAAVTVTNPGTSGGIYGGGTMAETSNSMTFTIQ